MGGVCLQCFKLCMCLFECACACLIVCTVLHSRQLSRQNCAERHINVEIMLPTALTAFLLNVFLFITHVQCHPVHLSNQPDEIFHKFFLSTHRDFSNKMVRNRKFVSILWISLRGANIQTDRHTEIAFLIE